ncbi:MAG: hypothetical protein KA406_04560 [Acinetobacter sp.]|nr:hypothetical protein [Acinetobacter sp.]
MNLFHLHVIFTAIEAKNTHWQQPKPSNQSSCEKFNGAKTAIYRLGS